MSGLSAKIVDNEDQRGDERSQTNEIARALIDSNLALSVTVIDISTSGARLLLEDGSAKFPESAKIYIAERDLIADCKVVWRNGNEIGVRFISTAFL